MARALGSVRHGRLARGPWPLSCAFCPRFVPGNFSAYLPPLAALGSLELASYSDFNTTVSTYQQPSNFQATEKYFFLACKLSAIKHIHSIRKGFLSRMIAKRKNQIKSF